MLTFFITLFDNTCVCAAITLCTCYIIPFIDILAEFLKNFTYIICFSNGVYLATPQSVTGEGERG